MKAITPGEIFRELNDFGIQNADPARVEKYARYFKEGYDAYGVNEGQLDKKIAELIEEYLVTYPIALNASLTLVASPKYEMPVAAFKLLLKFRKEWDRELFCIIEKWFPIGITNWAHTDYLCGELMPWLFKKNIIGPEDLLPWRVSEFRFQRRAAVVSLIKPMKLDTNYEKYYEFIAPMMADPERVVHQALGWLLREMWKKQPEPTEAFLMRFKETAPRLIFQYATEKMSTEGKERFRRTKGGRRADGGRTESGRKADGKRTEGGRKADGKRTEGGRKADGKRTEGGRKADGKRTEGGRKADLKKGHEKNKN